MLSNLPPELLIRILSFLDITSLSHFRCTSSASHELIKSSSEYLYRQLSYSHSFLEGCTASSAAGVIKRTGNIQLTKDYDPKELERAMIAENTQLSLSKQSLSTSWESFARKRWITNHNWLNRKFKTSFMTFSESIDDIWRFKLDPIGDRIVATLKSGDIKAFSKDGEVMFTFNSIARFPHIELSEGYFMVANEIGGFLVFRKTSILEPPSPLDSQTISASQSLGGDYSLHSILTGIPLCQATKARFPYFVACSAVNNKIYLFNYVEGILLKTFDSPSILVDRIQYIDFNAVQIFLAVGSVIWSVDIVTGLALNSTVFGTEWPMKIARRDDWNITAMHYDSLGNYCIAYDDTIRHLSVLLWSYRDSHSQGELIEVYFEVENRIDHICVENGRVVFLTSGSDATASLWLINLNHHRENISNWTLDPPRAYILVSPLPINETPARIEMSNNQIFIPCSSDYSPEVSINMNYLFLYCSFNKEELETLETVHVTTNQGEIPGVFIFKSSKKIEEKERAWSLRKSDEGNYIEHNAEENGTTSGFYILNFDEE